MAETRLVGPHQLIIPNLWKSSKQDWKHTPKQLLGLLGVWFQLMRCDARRNASGTQVMQPFHPAPMNDK